MTIFNKSLAVLTKPAIRFAFSGLLLTGVHVLVASALIQIVLLSPAVANGIAFLVATLLSYLINTIWSFSSSLHGKTLTRFLLVSIIGLSLSISISWATQYSGFDYLYGIGLVVFIVPPVTFFLHNFWTYK